MQKRTNRILPPPSQRIPLSPMNRLPPHPLRTRNKNLWSGLPPCLSLAKSGKRWKQRGSTRGKIGKSFRSWVFEFICKPTPVTCDSFDDSHGSSSNWWGDFHHADRWIGRNIGKFRQRMISICAGSWKIVNKTWQTRYHKKIFTSIQQSSSLSI